MLAAACCAAGAAWANPTAKVGLKIMSFNVRHCVGMDGKLDIERTAARIRTENPDFACLQEIDRRTARVNGIDQPSELAQLTGLHATFAKAIPYRGGEYGILILSREKPRAVERMPLPGKEPRVLLICEFADVVVATSHLSVGKDAERTASVPIIRSAFAKYSKPLFFTGDWNATPDSDLLAALGEFLTVKSETKCSTISKRRPLNGLDGRPHDMSKFCIDYIACDRAHAAAFTVADAHVIEDRVTSDHMPIVATFMPVIRKQAP